MQRNRLKADISCVAAVFIMLLVLPCVVFCGGYDDEYPSGSLYDMDAAPRPAKKIKRQKNKPAREKRRPRSNIEPVFAAGLGYPYLALKYTPRPSFSAEARFASGDGVNVYSGRLYWNFETSRSFRLFTGAEGGYVKFDTIDTRGKGAIWAAFGGLEYFVLKNISLSVDFSPTLVNLDSDGVNVNGLEWVANIAVYWHLF